MRLGELLASNRRSYVERFETSDDASETSPLNIVFPRPNDVIRLTESPRLVQLQRQENASK